MTKFSLSIPELHKSIIGFDRLFEQAERRLTGLASYPPHNIVKVDEQHYDIEFAVAGFYKDELELELQDGVLTLRGKQEPDITKHYVYQGIASRNFQKQLTLGEYMQIKTARLFENGMLVVRVEHQLPEVKKSKLIEIN